MKVLTDETVVKTLKANEHSEGKHKTSLSSHNEWNESYSTPCEAPR